MRGRNLALTAAAGLIIGVILLRGMLLPFVISAGLAYACSPLVDRLERWHIPRLAGVTAVYLGVVLLIALAIFLLLPRLESQASRLVKSTPDYVEYIKDFINPWIHRLVPGASGLDEDSVKALISDHWKSASELIQSMLEKISSSGSRIVSWGVNILLIPVILFYMMRDWNNMVAHIHRQIPRRHEPTVVELASEIDQRLGRFIRGQGMVMLTLAAYYAIGLWIAGLKLALIIGIGAGLVSFVPYLGVISGVLVASIAMLVQQSGDMTVLLWVWLVFGVGQALEQMILTPLLMGEAIGLHPVWIIFAILAGGQLFGFIGVLLALPVAAALAVLARHALSRWQQSRLYRQG